MTSIVFPVATYTLHMSTVRSLPSYMRLESVVQGPGVIDHLWLYFLNPGNPVAGQGSVNFFQSNPLGAHLVWYSSDEMFDRVYHMLQTEKPVWVHYDYQDAPGEISQPVVSLRLETGAEPIGEGPVDIDALVRPFPRLRQTTGNLRSQAPGPHWGGRLGGVGPPVALGTPGPGYGPPRW